jgi:hypothetical protein
MTVTERVRDAYIAWQWAKRQWHDECLIKERPRLECVEHRGSPRRGQRTMFPPRFLMEAVHWPVVVRDSVSFRKEGTTHHIWQVRSTVTRRDGSVCLAVPLSVREQVPVRAGNGTGSNTTHKSGWERQCLPACYSFRTKMHVCVCVHAEFTEGEQQKTETGLNDVGGACALLCAL